jgi:hypothetical protein
VRDFSISPRTSLLLELASEPQRNETGDRIKPAAKISLLAFNTIALEPGDIHEALRGDPRFELEGEPNMGYNDPLLSLTGRKNLVLVEQIFSVMRKCYRPDEVFPAKYEVIGVLSDVLKQLESPTRHFPKVVYAAPKTAIEACDRLSRPRAKRLAYPDLDNNILMVWDDDSKWFQADGLFIDYEAVKARQAAVRKNMEQRRAKMAKDKADRDAEDAEREFQAKHGATLQARMAEVKAEQEKEQALAEQKRLAQEAEAARLEKLHNPSPVDILIELATKLNKKSVIDQITAEGRQLLEATNGNQDYVDVQILELCIKMNLDWIRAKGAYTIAHHVIFGQISDRLKEIVNPSQYSLGLNYRSPLAEDGGKFFHWHDEVGAFVFPSISKKDQEDLLTIENLLAKVTKDTRLFKKWHKHNFHQLDTVRHHLKRIKWSHLYSQKLAYFHPESLSPARWCPVAKDFIFDQNTEAYKSHLRAKAEYDAIPAEQKEYLRRMNMGDKQWCWNYERAKFLEKQAAEKTLDLWNPAEIWHPKGKELFGMTPDEGLQPPEGWKI